MRNVFTILVFILTANASYAQIEAGLLFSLNTGTTSEINAITGMQQGQMLFNTDTRELLVFNGSNWVTTSNSNWLLTGNVGSNGSFLGTTNDVSMDIRSNNVSTLEVGRRQTLGLVQNYLDYTDGNQYLTYLKGVNGVSALQFQADAAAFYKPMFFTNSDGNFRLKGSAASTDFFEIGSNGVSNAGELEFIIADDGAEPFIFKRFDYRDQQLKELFRIQGSANAQNAKPRVGVNTGQMANSTLQVNGSVSAAIARITNSITLTEDHHTIIMTGGSPNITLPNANSCLGRVYIIKNYSGSNRFSSTYRTDNGGTSTQIRNGRCYMLQSDGVEWQQIVRD
ncbi:hypothetical protein [Flagellimonas pacifica]|uniref:T9SS C-terminal target domain-containing protein n=1 Tax=Flagellimonas pacifica TaxID=1247520 RepID=A0A285MZ47_9FLAO|nr:hypothetical protein [Allomuricauda parva]SNZ00751.1 hypothetical protein SAMN06265377_2577 [Allomuricauda parva]